MTCGEKTESSDFIVRSQTNFSSASFFVRILLPADTASRLWLRNAYGRGRPRPSHDCHCEDKFHQRRALGDARRNLYSRERALKSSKVRATGNLTLNFEILNLLFAAQETLGDAHERVQEVDDRHLRRARRAGQRGRNNLGDLYAESGQT